MIGKNMTAMAWEWRVAGAARIILENIAGLRMNTNDHEVGGKADLPSALRSPGNPPP
jgi:NADH:ubiquinone oxidoreductase subunit D